MERAKHEQFSRRERQIMDVLYAKGQASAAEVRDTILDPPTKTSVRTLLRILEAKGHVRHQQVGKTYVYAPSRPRERAGRSALRRVIETFFGGSIEKAVAAHFADSASTLDDAELERLSSLIREARRRGR